MQRELQLIARHVEGVSVEQRTLDGYVNATAMCKAAGRPWSRYWENPTSKEFGRELSSVLGKPITELIQSVTGGVPEHQGTWVHPQVAIHLGQWLSPRFAVMVSGWVHEWMTGGAARAPMPYHLRRYGLNRGSVPLGHFSVFNEMILAIVGPMEEAGYTLPDRLVPDISEGRMFSQWLKLKMGVDVVSLPTYPHRYEDGRVVQARAYPDKHLADFRAHLNGVWIPQRAAIYFRDRDKDALRYLSAILPKTLAHA